MEKYVLSQSELSIIVLGTLYHGLIEEPNHCITTLDIKNYLREERNANITQEDVRVAMDEFYNIWVEDNSVIQINNKFYDLKYQISADGTHKEYYIEEISSDEVLDEEEDNEDIVKQFIIDNMSMSSYDIVKSLKASYGDSLAIPGQASVAAIKANITRKK